MTPGGEELGRAPPRSLMAEACPAKMPDVKCMVGEVGVAACVSVWRLLHGRSCPPMRLCTRSLRR